MHNGMNSAKIVIRLITAVMQPSSLIKPHKIEGLKHSNF